MHKSLRGAGTLKIAIKPDLTWKMLHEGRQGVQKRAVQACSCDRIGFSGVVLNAPQARKSGGEGARWKGVRKV